MVRRRSVKGLRGKKMRSVRTQSTQGSSSSSTVVVFFTQCADGVLTLLYLFSHQPADGHQTLCDVTAGFN